MKPPRPIIELASQVECLRCHHKWTPRVPSPRFCASCNSPTWWIPRGVLKAGRPKGVKRVQPRLPPPPPPPPLNTTSLDDLIRLLAERRRKAPP